MTSDDSELEAPKRGFPAQVAHIVDEYRIVINRGGRDGVFLGQEFSVFTHSETSIVDPETGKPLERLEILKGRGKVSHLQATVATVTSSQTKRISSPFLMGVEGSGRTVRAPFDTVEVGDYARPVKD